MAPSNSHEIVILGGHFAGLSIAHYLLKHTIPLLSKLDSSISYHVTIVTPNTHVYWKIGAPRAVASPKLLPTEKMFAPIADGFTDYPSDQYKFVQGIAVALDPKKRVVTVDLSSNGTTTVPYSTLIVATGTTANTALWSMKGSHENNLNALKEIHKSLPSAKTILLAGGGPVGVETTGEIACAFPKAQTTLLSGGSRVLEKLLPATSKDAESRLKKLGVEVVHNLRVTSVSEGKEGAPTEVTLSDGSKRTVDVYIDCTGGKVNTSFLPKSWLNERGQVLVEEKYLRPTAPGTEGVYAIGDTASISDQTIIGVKQALQPLGRTITIDLAAKVTKETSALPKQEPYKPMAGTQLVPIGTQGGVGQVFGWRIFSLMVWGIKGRTYMVENMPSWVNGGEVSKA